MQFLYNQIDFYNLGLVSPLNESMYYVEGKHDSCCFVFQDSRPAIGDKIILYCKKEACRRRGLSGPRNSIKTVYRIKIAPDIIPNGILEIGEQRYDCPSYPLYDAQQRFMNITDAQVHDEIIDVTVAKIYVRSYVMGNYVRKSVRINEQPWGTIGEYCRWLESTQCTLLNDDVEILAQTLKSLI